MSASVHAGYFPAYDAELAKDDTVTIGVQINGKMRGTVTIPPNATAKEAQTAVYSSPELETRLAGKTLQKFIYVPARIVNLIIEE
ncbi:MAG: hypothetical protein RLZZ480_197 [Candidatus Parcubacteria bacterium]|jgi:leucyl-tRNA synthetase